MAGRKLRYARDYTPSDPADASADGGSGYTYTGKTYISAAENYAGAVRKCMLFLMAGWGAFLAALLLNSRAMRTAWISLPFVFCGLCLYLVSGSLFGLRKKTVFRQKEADLANDRFPPVSLFLAVLALLALAADLLRLVSGGRDGFGEGGNLFPGDVLFPICAAVLFGAGAGLFRMRKRIRLKEDGKEEAVRSDRKKRPEEAPRQRD